MRSDALTMTLLYDYYGELLTEKQRGLFDLYYNQDYSLSEIASAAGISRQGVHDTLARAEELLEGYEAALGCIARDRQLQKALEALDGVQSAEVSHEKGTAVVSLTHDVADADLKTAVEARDYTVTGIDA